jgi:hypothetical protein
MRRTLLLFATLLMLGAGCAPRVPEPVADDTPNANLTNCEKSGGALGEDGYCQCPEGYMPDPADFCLDAQGVPGGEMRP